MSEEDLIFMEAKTGKIPGTKIVFVQRIGLEKFKKKYLPIIHVNGKYNGVCYDSAEAWYMNLEVVNWLNKQSDIQIDFTDWGKKRQTNKGQMRLV